MYFTLFWGQCHFSGGRLEDFQTTAFQWIDSASLKVISAGETISTLVPGRRRLMSGSWCHVSLWMNISCAAPSSTSASPSLLCLLALHCPLHLWFLYSFFSPALEHAAATNTHVLGWWLLMNTVSTLQWLPLLHGCPWEFPLLLKLLWQFVNLHHMANVASLSTVVTVAHLSLNLQNEALSGSEYPPLSLTKQIWSVFSAGAL